MNVIASLPQTRRGHDSMWVGANWLTKLAKFIPTKTKEQLMNWLTNSLMSHYNFTSYQFVDVETITIKHLVIHKNISSKPHLLKNIMDASTNNFKSTKISK